MITLNFEKRAMAVSPEKIRENGQLPAVFYGPKEKSTPIVISYIDFVKTWKKAGESSVIILKGAGAKATDDEHEALIHEVDVHPVTGTPRHVDFYVVEKGKKIKVHVQLVFEGVSAAVKDLGGILVKVLREVEIEAAPKDLPHELKVDIAALSELTSVVSAKDIKLPAGVTLVNNPEEIVASIAEAKEELEEAPTAVDMTAIEVAKKGKEAKEGEEGEADAKDDKKADAKK